MPLTEPVAGGEQEPLAWLGPINSHPLEPGGGELNLLGRGGRHFEKKILAPRRLGCEEGGGLSVDKANSVYGIFPESLAGRSRPIWISRVCCGTSIKAHFALQLVSTPPLS